MKSLLGGLPKKLRQRDAFFSARAAQLQPRRCEAGCMFAKLRTKLRTLLGHPQPRRPRRDSHREHGGRVAQLLVDDELAVDLLFEWDVVPTENLLVVAARAGAWAREDFASDPDSRRAFVAGFVAEIMATGGWPRATVSQKSAGLAVLETMNEPAPASTGGAT
jgi:hypothetical protein